MFRRKSIRPGQTAIAVAGLPALTLFVAVTGAQAQGRVAGLDLRANLGLGHDSNSFREAAATDPGTFLPYDLRARYETAPGERSLLRFRGSASGDEYVGAVSDGGERDFDLGADWSQRLVGDGARRSRHLALRTDVHGDFEINKRKYISRADGEEYTVDFQGVPMPLGDRYNSKDLEAGGEISLEWPSQTELSLLYELRHRDYDEDYTEIPDVDRLDNRRSRAGLRVTQDIGRRVRLRGEYTYEHTDYYDRSVHDLQGDRVQGVAQTFDRNSLGGEVRWKMGRAVRATLQGGWSMRRDPYQGYYDSQEWSVGPQVKFDATPRLEFQAGYGYVHRTYEHARVAFDPLLPLRDDREHEFSLESTYQLDSRNAIFFVVEHDTVDEMNPIYSYDRTRSWVGYQVRY